MLLALLLVSVSVAGASEPAQFDVNGQVRFVHAIPGAPEVDVYVGGELTAFALDYGEATDYIIVPAGLQDVTVTVSGLATILWEQQVSVADSPLLLIASNASAPTFDVYPETLEPLPLGTTRFAVLHAVADGPAVQVIADGDAVGAALNYGDYLGTFDVPSAVFELSAVVDGSDDVVVPPAPTGLVTGTAQTLIVYGTTAIPESLLLSAPTVGDAEAGAVRVAHTVAGAPAVDVVVPGEAPVVLVPGLEFGETTSHLALPAGDYTVELRESGTTNVLLEAELSVEAGVAATVAAIGTPDALEVAVYPDDISGVAAENAVLNVLNTIPGDSAVTVALADGTVIAEGVTFGETSGPVSLEPTAQNPVITFTIDGMSATLELNEQTFYGGVYYNVVAVDATMFSPPTLLFASTALAQTVGSAPGEGVDLLVEAATPAPETAATPETGGEAPPAAPTEAPAVQPTPAPAVVTDEDAVTARVNLNPDANLQLRIFPDPTSQSLGLAPANSVLVVNGREGAPVDLEGNELPVLDADGNEVEYVDPATLLEDEDDDLAPEDTWLNITYTTPDGGFITAWVNAQFLIVRDADGELQRLADLPTIPQNREGEVSGTDITPPAPQEDVVTVTVIGLNPDANLNLRRTPETDGEVLAGIPNGTVLEFLGLPVIEGEEGVPAATPTAVEGVTLEDWVFVRYLPPEGGSITGWVFNQFLIYQLNGEEVSLDELFARELVPGVDPTTIGEVSANAPEFVPPTPDPLLDAYVATVELDPGANLNLRRTPSDQGEVLVQIPSGSQVVIDGRTADGLWLQTTFEGFTGWISSRFVSLTFNGELVEVEEIPITDDTDAGEEETETGGEG